jgi:hypothetical protein
VTVLAHGIGGIRDLPVPTYLFFYGAATVLVLSFVALAFLWRKPVLEEKATGRPLPDGLQKFLLAPELHAFVQAVAFVLLAVVWCAAAFGKPSSGANLAPYFVFVIFWVGVVPLVVLFGNVWSVLNPWRAAADGVAWLAEQAGIRRERPPLDYPERLGLLPGALLLFAFATLELAYVDPSSPRTLATAIVIYSGINWAGMFLFGRRAWLENGDAFAIYFGLLSRIAPMGVERGRIVVRPPFSGLARTPWHPGTLAFVSVMLGSVLWDGFSRTSLWQNKYYDVQIQLLDSPTKADIVGTLMSVGGLTAAVLAVGLAYRLAVLGTEWVSEDEGGLSSDFVWSLVPIALVYVVAHYFTLLIYQGQVAVRLASDPFGKGWDLFRTDDFQPNFTLLSPNLVWYVQVGALVVGHVAGLTLAHDRAVGLFRSARVAMWSQYPMLALMVAYTVGGMWVLSQG